MLGDFAKFLEAIGAQGTEVTKAGKVPKVRFMAQLNQQMAHPIQLGLKRPQPKAYPNVTGMYLLLRVIGLGRIENENHLILDEAALERWHRLNPTEQYFTLLESWILRGSPELLGEHGNLYYSALRQWLEFHLAIPKEGLAIAGRYEKNQYLAFTPGWTNLALLELFGILTLEHGQPLTGKGWRVKRAERTPFGDALLAQLFDFLALEPPQENQSQLFGRLQPVLQPFFPAWNSNFSLPEDPAADGLHIFKVSLGRVWRRIAIAADSTMDLLADAILQAYAFDYDHLYQFTWVNRFGLSTHLNHAYMDEPPFAEEVKVGTVGLAPGDAITFLYDFGDNWEFTVLLERIEPAKKNYKKPVLLESRGKAPEQYPDWDE